MKYFHLTTYKINAKLPRGSDIYYIIYTSDFPDVITQLVQLTHKKNLNIIIR